VEIGQERPLALGVLEVLTLAGDGRLVLAALVSKHLGSPLIREAKPPGGRAAAGVADFEARLGASWSDALLTERLRWRRYRLERPPTENPRDPPARATRRRPADSACRSRGRGWCPASPCRCGHGGGRAAATRRCTRTVGPRCESLAGRGRS